MSGTYSTDLVLLSIFVAVMASYSALDLTSRVSGAQGRDARVWLLGGAVAMGAGIWSMHFIGMLAFSLPIRLAYDFSITLVSLLIAIVLSAFALSVVSRPVLSTRGLFAGGVVMGVGICAMHYSGMAATRMSPPIHYDPLLFAASVVIAIGASIVALHLSYILRARATGSVVWFRVLSAVVMGLAISGMHYTGMAAAHFAPGALCLATDSFDLGNAALGYVIGGTILSLLTITLIVSAFDARMASATARLAAIVESSADAIISVDLNAVITTWNRGAERMFGYTAREATGQLVRRLIPSESINEAPDIGERIRRGLTIEHYETIRRSKDGTPLDISMTVSPILNTHGQIVGASKIARDITERKRNEVALVAALSAAEKANLAKSDFLSSMSHELRTPLNAILGFAQLQRAESVHSVTPTASQQNNEQILEAGWYLLELINEILDLAQIESGKLALSVKPVSLGEILHECQAMIEPQAHERGISLKFPQFETPRFVSADRTRLKQVLINLLSNAIKYNKQAGGITVECSLNPPDRIRISVCDTGAGLHPEQLAQLFQPFNRLGMENSTEEGTGIGLVLSKRLMQLMGGEIGVDSSAGAGSTFWIELSLTTAAQSAVQQATLASPPQTAAGAEQRTVLCVEDNPANLKLMEQFIAHRGGLRLLSAADASTGIEMARQHQPDLILMDINLPGLSGTQAMQILRAAPLTARIPVIAVSANALPRDIERALDAGFFSYITKPIKLDRFMQTLDAALASTSGPAPHQAAEKKPA